MTAAGLFTEEWFERARSEVGDAVHGPAEDVVVEYRCTSASGELCHHQVFERGRLVDWRRGPADQPDVSLRQPASANLRMLTRRGLGNDLMCASRLVGDGGGGSGGSADGDDLGGWVPPLDEVETAWGRALPTYPGVGEHVVQQEVTETPFGDVTMWFRIDGGPVVDAGVGVSTTEPDVTVRRRFGPALRERAGRIDVLESLDGGGIAGDTGKLMLFVGALDADECADARRALARPTDEPLVFLGEVLSSPGWTVVADRLAALATELKSVP